MMAMAMIIMNWWSLKLHDEDEEKGDNAMVHDSDYDDDELMMLDYDITVVEHEWMRCIFLR